MIFVDELCYQVEDKILFENACLQLDPGQYQLLGNNGVGKTSFLNLLTNNVKQQSGKVDMSLNYMYITQEPVLLNNLSVFANVKFFNPQKQSIVIENLEKFRINRSKKIKDLSGGQKQLVYLEIFLNTDFDLYLIDEPFNNLDKNRVEYIKSLISKKDNVIIIDHLNKFSFKKLHIKQRGLQCVY